jgi:hypothetical protein
MLVGKFSQCGTVGPGSSGQGFSPFGFWLHPEVSDYTFGHSLKRRGGDHSTITAKSRLHLWFVHHHGDYDLGIFRRKITNE